MKTMFRLRIAVATAGFLALSAAAARSEVTIEQPWVRATPGVAKVTAGYAVIVNSGPAADQLVAVGTPSAEMTELHQSRGEGGMMAMQAVPVLEIPANGRVELKPGDYHLMIMGLARPLKVGETIELEFTFKSAGKRRVLAKVAPLAATAAP